MGIKLRHLELGSSFLFMVTDLNLSEHTAVIPIFTAFVLAIACCKYGQNKESGFRLPKTTKIRPCVIGYT